MDSTTNEALRFARWLQSVEVGIIGEDVDVDRMHERWKRDEVPAPVSTEETEPYCNHDPAALMSVDLYVCECGAYVDPDTGREFAAVELAGVDPATRDRYAYPAGYDAVTDAHGNPA